MRIVQFVVDAVLYDVLQDRRPTRHLVRLLRHAFLATNLPNAFAIALKERANVKTFIRENFWEKAFFLRQRRRCIRGETNW